MRQFNPANHFVLGGGCHYRILVVMPAPSPPDFWVVLTAPVTSSSPGCRLPLSSWATAVLVWSVIPVRICTGCSDLSAATFHTTLTSWRGTRPAAAEVLLPFAGLLALAKPLGAGPAIWLRPYFSYIARSCSGFMSGLKRSAVLGTSRTFSALATGTLT